MERVSVTVERSEYVRLVLEEGSRWSAQGPAMFGYGETPSEALADYRRKLEEETHLIMDKIQVWQRQGFMVVEKRAQQPGAPPT